MNLKWSYSVLNEDHEKEIPMRTFAIARLSSRFSE